MNTNGTELEQAVCTYRTESCRRGSGELDPSLRSWISTPVHSSLSRVQGRSPSGNSGWDVNGTHVFQAFHRKVPENKWNFRKGSPVFPLEIFPACSIYEFAPTSSPGLFPQKMGGKSPGEEVGVCKRNHQFHAIHDDLCAILNFADESINEWNLCQNEHDLHSIDLSMEVSESFR